MKALPFRFLVSALVVSLASIAAYAQSAGQAQQKTAQEDEFLKGVYLPDTPSLVAPVMLYQTHPKYTSDAMRAKIQGDVEVQAVILADGLVDRVRVTTSLDKVFGLDESSMAAAKQWRFKPGTLNGQPVPVAVTLKLTFRLH
jgi:TonB family protein